MEYESSIARMLRIYQKQIRYDAACCSVLANKYISAWIMKSCMFEFCNYEVAYIAEKLIESSPQLSQVPVHPDEIFTEEIRGSQTVDKLMNEGTITYDIRFYAKIPNSDKLTELIIDIEAQNDFYPSYPIVSRGIYYNSRAISSQFHVEFMGHHYEKIKKSYSIWVCTNPPKNRSNTINEYKISENQIIGNYEEAREHYDLSTVVMICLSSSGVQEATGILRLLGVLLSKDVTFEEKKRILENEFQIKMNRELEEEMNEMCNLSKGILKDGIAIGEARGRKDGITIGEAKGRKDGIAIGEAKGRKDGIAIGEAKGRKDGIAIGEARGRKDGIAIGQTKEKVKSIKSLMETLNCTAIHAMNLLKYSEEEQIRYLKLM